jgi:hypothetical protein
MKSLAAFGELARKVGAVTHVTHTNDPRVTGGEKDKIFQISHLTRA